VAKALPRIAQAIDLVATALQHGGRLIYVGTGTSGRLGALDSSECPPTFNAGPRLVQYVIAGGDKALGHAVEASEDSPAQGRAGIKRKRITRNDVVVGLAASGRTPYTLAALEYARAQGAATICITAAPGSPITRIAQLAIAIDTGPEAISGSTRLKAGTMQKLVCNMLTTGAFTRMGYVYGNLMVNAHLKNRKLVERGVRIVSRLTGLDKAQALALLAQTKGSVPLAIVMQKRGVKLAEARRLLRAAKGNVRAAAEG
jgi:N-acetylmuramic acid 6-phosphate etherase